MRAWGLDKPSEAVIGSSKIVAFRETMLAAIPRMFAIEEFFACARLVVVAMFCQIVRMTLRNGGSGNRKFTTGACLFANLKLIDGEMSERLP